MNNPNEPFSVPPEGAPIPGQPSQPPAAGYPAPPYSAPVPRQGTPIPPAGPSPAPTYGSSAPQPPYGAPPQSPYGGPPVPPYGGPPQAPHGAPPKNNSTLLIGLIAALVLVIAVGATLYFTGAIGGRDNGAGERLTISRNAVIGSWSTDGDCSTHISEFTAGGDMWQHNLQPSGGGDPPRRAGSWRLNGNRLTTSNEVAGMSPIEVDYVINWVSSDTINVTRTGEEKTWPRCQTTLANGGSSTPSGATGAVGDVAPRYLPLTSQNFAGHWTNTGCGQGVEYRADGTWGLRGGPYQNTFSIHGNQIHSTLSGGGGTAVYRIERLTSNSYDEISAQGTTSSYRRCGGSAAPSAGGNIAAQLQQAVAQFQSRLPMRNGPTTITSVTAAGTTMRMQGMIARTMTPAEWAQLDAGMRPRLCAGPLANLVRAGGTIDVMMQDQANAMHVLTISSC